MPDDRDRVNVDGHDVAVARLDKLMYPGSADTKGDVIDYYLAVAPVLLPHITDRPMTRIQYPDGTDGKSFFAKNAPRHTPDWIRTENVATPHSTKGRESIDYIVVDDAATLIWLADQAALELHTPQWRFNASRAERRPDRLVADLDPGDPAGMAECVRVAVLLRDRFAADGLTGYPKSSGKKGLHVCCPIAGTQSDATVSDYAKRVADELADEHPDLITAKMPKDQRRGKVFIDWSQNNANKTTAAPYALRNRSAATVSTPMTWDEVESGANGRFSPREVLDRVDRHGDLFGEVLEKGPKVPR